MLLSLMYLLFIVYSYRPCKFIRVRAYVGVQVCYSVFCLRKQISSFVKSHYNKKRHHNSDGCMHVFLFDLLL